MNQPVQGCPSPSLCSSSRTLPPFSYRSQQHPTISFLGALFLLFAIPFRQHFPRICVLRHPTNVVRTPRSLGFYAGFYCWASENPLYAFVLCLHPPFSIFTPPEIFWSIRLSHISRFDLHLCCFVQTQVCSSRYHFGLE